MLSGQDTMIWDLLRTRYKGGRILAAECSGNLMERVLSMSPSPEVIEWDDEDRRQFCRNVWPGTTGDFSFVLLGRLAERIEDFAIVRVLYRHLLEDGSLISLWGNPQHWSVINDLLSGNYRFSENPIFQEMPHKLFSLKEMTNFFMCMKFRDFRISSAVKPGEAAYLQKLQELNEADNRHLLETAFWCIEARKYTEDVLILKKKLTPQLRKELARVLRRIENGIDVEVNCALANDFLKSQEISYEYLELFAHNVTLNYPLVLKRLQER